MEPFSFNEEQLKAVIRQVLAEQEKPQSSSFEKTADAKSGVISVRGASVKPEAFDTGKAGDQVYLKDVFSLEESPRLGCGIMEMTASCFDWVLKYDEIDYVIEGRLEIVVDGNKIVGEAGDILLIPRNTAIQFSVPKFARFLYTTYPANWEEQ